MRGRVKDTSYPFIAFFPGNTQHVKIQATVEGSEAEEFVRESAELSGDSVGFPDPFPFFIRSFSFRLLSSSSPENFRISSERKP